MDYLFYCCNLILQCAKKKKMEFHIPVDVDDETFARYKERLETLVN